MQLTVRMTQPTKVAIDALPQVEWSLPDYLSRETVDQDGSRQHAATRLVGGDGRLNADDVPHGHCQHAGRSLTAMSLFADLL